MSIFWEKESCISRTTNTEGEYFTLPQYRIMRSGLSFTPRLGPCNYTLEMRHHRCKGTESGGEVSIQEAGPVPNPEGFELGPKKKCISRDRARHPYEHMEMRVFWSFFSHRFEFKSKLNKIRVECLLNLRLPEW